MMFAHLVFTLLNLFAVSETVGLLVSSLAGGGSRSSKGPDDAGRCVRLPLMRWLLYWVVVYLFSLASSFVSAVLSGVVPLVDELQVLAFVALVYREREKMLDSLPDVYRTIQDKRGQLVQFLKAIEPLQTVPGFGFVLALLTPKDAVVNQKAD